MAKKLNPTEKDSMSKANKSFLKTSVSKQADNKERCFSIPDIKVISADDAPSLKTIQRKLSGEQTPKAKLHRCNAFSDAELATKLLSDGSTSESISKQNLLHVFLRSFTSDPELAETYVSRNYRYCRSLPDLADCIYNTGADIRKDDFVSFNRKLLSPNPNFLSVDSILDVDNDVFDLSPHSSSHSKNSLMAVCASNPPSLSSESDDGNEDSGEKSGYMAFLGDMYEIPEKVCNSSNFFQYDEQGRALKRCFSLGSAE